MIAIRPCEVGGCGYCTTANPVLVVSDDPFGYTGGESRYQCIVDVHKEVAMATVKQPYTRPSLTIHGTVAALTSNGGGGTGDGMAGSIPPR